MFDLQCYDSNTIKVFLFVIAHVIKHKENMHIRFLGMKVDQQELLQPSSHIIFKYIWFYRFQPTVRTFLLRKYKIENLQEHERARANLIKLILGKQLLNNTIHRLQRIINFFTQTHHTLYLLLSYVSYLKSIKKVYRRILNRRHISAKCFENTLMYAEINFPVLFNPSINK